MAIARRRSLSSAIESCRRAHQHHGKSSLILKAYLHTLALWQTDPWLLPPNDEDVTLPCSKRVVYSIFDVDDIETTIVAFSVGNHTDTTHVATTSCHGDDTGIEADEIGNFASGQVNLDCVIDLDRRVRITDPTAPNISPLCLMARECRQNLVQRLKDAAELTFVHRA